MVESRHKGRRIWVTAVGSAVVLVGFGLGMLAVVAGGGFNVLFGVVIAIVGGLIILVNEGFGVMDGPEREERKDGRMF